MDILEVSKVQIFKSKWSVLFSHTVTQSALAALTLFMLFLGLKFTVNNVEISQNYFFKENLLVKDNIRSF
jgi:hypothetical protein